MGNGLIAAFVAGVALGGRRARHPGGVRPLQRERQRHLPGDTFFLFGALIVDTPWDNGALVLLAFIAFALLVARPAAVLLSLAGTRLPQPDKLFIAWFGPKGVASMLFALLVLNSAVPHNELVFEAASFVILASILAHGLTDTVGTRWIDAPRPRGPRRLGPQGTV